MHLGRIVFGSGNGISFGKPFNAIFTADMTVSPWTRAGLHD